MRNQVKNLSENAQVHISDTDNSRNEETSQAQLLKKLLDWCPPKDYIDTLIYLMAEYINSDSADYAPRRREINNNYTSLLEFFRGLEINEKNI